MVLTILVLIHRCFFSKNTGPEHSSNSSGAAEEFCKESKFTSKQEIVVPQSKPVAARAAYPNYKENSLESANKSQSNFRVELAIIAVCRFSTSLISNPEQKGSKSYSEMSIEEKFRAAVRVIHSLPKDGTGPYQPSNSMKLKFYGLYKQATEGKNSTAKPGFWDVVGRAKWEAWNKHGDMSKEEAMNQYVGCLKEIVETMSFNGDVEDFLDSIGPFYEFVTLQGNEMSHIKEKIEEVTSSSGSSLSNSLSSSLNNSKQNSPTKEILTIRQAGEEAEDEEASISETAEVSVETSTATYETKVGKSYSSQNGNAIKMSNGQRHVTYEDTAKGCPPAPVHSYSHQNGFVKKVNNEDDEVLTVSSSPYIPCKEDLERDIDDDGRGHAKVKVTSSIETVASVATSGTESEKYYSGDSEPEMDEKFMGSSYTVTSSHVYPSTSAALQQKMREDNVYHHNTLSTKQISNSNSPLKKLKTPRQSNSPSQSSTSVCKSDADVVVQQTVERLNRDVDHILARLRILEAAYSANAENAVRNSSGGHSNNSNSSRRKSRIFGDLSPQSIAFIVMWPFVAQFLIKLLRWWWRRRRNTFAAMRSITN